jgi:hypothetical protein
MLPLSEGLSKDRERPPSRLASDLSKRLAPLYGPASIEPDSK